MKRLCGTMLAIMAVVGLAFWGCGKDNPVTVSTGSITGVVTDSTSGVAISGASVVTSPATSSVTTNTAGQFTINGVNAGNYMVTASKTGYNSKSVSVVITAGNTAAANIVLSDTTVGSASIIWVAIPAGNFTMGSITSDPLYYTDELPQHIVYLDAYQISKYEVTNAQYKAFMEAEGYTNSTYWTTEGWAWRTAGTITEPRWWSDSIYNNGPAFPNYPVVGVSWYEAYAFCNWAGAHLPTEAQWEKAARGTDSSYYWPWGSVWDAGKCNSHYNTSPDTFAYTSPVGYFSAGQSPYGVYDMAGNVWEWCNDWYQSDYYSISPTSNPTGPVTGHNRVLRGGSLTDDDENCRTANRGSDTMVIRYYYIGFRPAK